MSDLLGGAPPFSDDPELEELFASDPELMALARRVRESWPEPVLDPRFHAVLRARLMREARTALAPRRPLFRRRVLSPLAWGAAGTVAALAAAAVVAVTLDLTLPTGTHPLAVVTSNVSRDPAVDPHQAITLSFNQPMDTRDQALASKLRIQPATAFTVAWKNPTTLVVTPLHPLATDTVYRVVIPAAAVHSQSGATLASPVTISFGTAPTPTPGPTTTPEPSLRPVALAQAAPGASAFWDGSGTPGITASTAPAATPAPSPAATSGTTGSPAPSPSGTGLPASPAAGSPGPSPASGGAVVFPASSPALTISAGATTGVALSPNGFDLALAVSQPDGTSTLVVEQAHSSDPRSTATTLWPRSGAPGARVTSLAWQDDNRIVFVTPQGIQTVTLLGRTATLAAFPPGESAAGVVLSGNGRYAFVPAGDVAAGAAGGPASPVASASPSAGTTTSPTASPSAATTASAAPTAPASTAAASPPAAGCAGASSASPSPGAATPSCSPGDGWLLALPTGGGSATTLAQLPGSAAGPVALSGDGSRVAWAAGGTAKAPRILELPTATPLAAPSAVPGLTVPGIDALALSQHGGRVAYSLDPGGVTIAATSNGSVVGTASGPASSLGFSPDGAQLAYISSGTLMVAPLEAGAVAPALVSPCEGGDRTLSEFVTAQVGDQVAQLGALSSPGVGAVAATPPDLSRGYVVSARCSAAPASGSGAPSASPSASPSATATPSASASAGASPSPSGGATLMASARLIVDPSGSSPGQLTDETVVLTETGGQWLVTSLEVPPLHALGAGPSVLSVAVTPPASTSANPETAVTVTFDADLVSSSVGAGSIQIVDAHGQVIPLVSPPAYDPASRQVSLVVAGSLPDGAEVVVGTSITDIDGGHPAAQASYPIGP